MTEGPYKLPEGWRWVRLGEVCDGERKTLDPRRFPEKEFVVYSIPAYDKNQSPELLKGAEIGSSKLVIEPGVCLFSKLNPRIPRAWVVKENLPTRNITLLASTEFMPLRPYSSALDLDYLRILLLSDIFLNQVRIDVTGATGSRQRLRPDTVLGALIPLPPLSEQRRIVARIEELMARVREARRLRQEAQEDAERLWQSVLAQTFPRPGSELPEGWRWVRLGEVARIYAGSPAPQGEQYFREGKWPFVRVQDLGRYGQTTCLRETTDYVNEYAVQKYRLRLAKAGTVLFPKSGAAILTNSRAVLGVNAYIVSHLAAVEPHSDRLDTYWIYFWLCTVDMKEFIDNPSYPSLRLSEISKLLIPLPPLEEQRRIVAYLEAVQEKIKALKEAQAATEAELKRLEQAILEKAFRGEL